MQIKLNLKNFFNKFSTKIVSTNEDVNYRRSTSAGVHMYNNKSLNIINENLTITYIF